MLISRQKQKYIQTQHMQKNCSTPPPHCLSVSFLGKRNNLTNKQTNVEISAIYRSGGDWAQNSQISQVLESELTTRIVCSLTEARMCLSKHICKMFGRRVMTIHAFCLSLFITAYDKNFFSSGSLEVLSPIFLKELILERCP